MVVRVSPRFTLPGEIVVGIVSTAWGIGGDLGNGPIHHILAEKNDLFVWAVLFLTAGLAMLFASVREYVYGGNWTDGQLHRSASIRSTCQFFSFFTWVYVLKLLFDLDGGMLAALSLVFMAPFLAACCAWFFYETLRVRYALDRRIHTPNLVIRR